MSNGNNQPKCQHCTKLIPNGSFHWSNIAAHKHGYCSFSCMQGELGQEVALKALDDEQVEARKRL